MVAPDATKVEWLRGRSRVPRDFEAAAAQWLSFASDPGAVFNREVVLDGVSVTLMVTWGSTPVQAVAVDGRVPTPASDTAAQAVECMRLRPDAPVAGHPVDVVVVGSRTNGPLEDLRAAADVLRGRTVAAGVRMLVTPGWVAVRRPGPAHLLRLALRRGRPASDRVAHRQGGHRPPGAGGRPQLRLRIVAGARALSVARPGRARDHSQRDRRRFLATR